MTTLRRKFRVCARRTRWLGFAALTLVFAGLSTARALEIADWKNRQPLAVGQAGVIKLALPPATLDLARPGLEDLRLLDASDREIPFIIEPPSPPADSTILPARSFRSTLTADATQLIIETGTDAALETIVLETPAAGFIKAARVELSTTGDTWETTSAGSPVFRQFGAEQLHLALAGRRATRVRVTLDDARSRPVPFTGAGVHVVPATPPITTDLPELRVVRREEFAGETVLTLDLGAAHVPLATLEFLTAEPLFARAVSLTVRELRDTTAVERTLATGSIYRVAVEGLPPSAQLEVPLNFTAPSRELLVHITNGDSPPLSFDTVRIRQRPRWLIFRAAAPGAFTVLTGNSLAPAPRYDLAALASALKVSPPSPFFIGAATANPGYRRPETLADTPLLGAALDVAAWKSHKPVLLAASGVQELELDLDVLAGAQKGLVDLRLVRDGVQVPYLVERPALSRSTPLTLIPVNDPKRPRVSRWEIKLARAALPFSRLTFTSPTPLFQRRLRLFETITDDRGETRELSLAEANWNKTPGDNRTLALTLSSVPTTALLTLETDDGDNAPLGLTTVFANHAVARLLFKITPGPLALYYGNDRAAAPRYDLALVAGQILSAEKSFATLGAEEPARPTRLNAGAWMGARSGVVFWAALGLVVIVLLVVVAKLLPKPPEA